MDYKQLIISDESQITIEEKRFLDLHKEIVYAGTAAAEMIVQFYAKLKEMRDSKSYAAAGFETFGDYVESAVGIKERMAYNYIKAYENLPQSFLQSNAKLGVTKLSLLAGLTATDRAEIMTENNVEDISVKELQAIIKEQEDRISQLEISLEEENDTVDLRSKLARAEDTAERATEAAERVKKEAAEAIEKAKKAAEKKEKDLREAVEQKERDYALLSKEMEDLRAAPAEVQTIPDPEATAKAEALEKELKEKQKDLDFASEEMRKLNEKLKLASNDFVPKFKVKFEDMQRNYNELQELLGKMSGEVKEKCAEALKKIIGGWSA